MLKDSKLPMKSGTLLTMCLSLSERFALSVGSRLYWLYSLQRDKIFPKKCPEYDYAASGGEAAALEI